ncbi:MAG: hypothetical protein H7287_04220 [Thermoleophilia bacterium]|nr:hypothetical protein [Thermoleophilia bacterium]
MNWRLVMVAGGLIASMSTSAGAAQAATTTIPGTEGRNDTITGNQPVMQGNFLVWHGGADAPAGVQCPAGADGKVQYMPRPWRFVDVRAPLDARSVPASVEQGVVEIDALDQMLDGQAAGTRHMCDGTRRLVRVDLHTATATDVATSAPMEQFTRLVSLVRGELVRSVEVDNFPKDPVAHHVTRIDLVTGATQTIRMGIATYRPTDTPTLGHTSLARSASGDLFWAVGYRAKVDTMAYAYDPCGGPARMRMWSSATGSVSVITPRMRLRQVVTRALGPGRGDVLGRVRPRHAHDVRGAPGVVSRPRRWRLPGLLMAPAWRVWTALVCEVGRAALLHPRARRRVGRAPATAARALWAVPAAHRRGRRCVGLGDDIEVSRPGGRGARSRHTSDRPAAGG